MSNETKNKTAADTVAENLQAIAEAVATNAPSAEEVAKAAAAVASAPGKPAKQKSGNAKPKAAAATGALKAIGLAACKRHGLKAVWVTDDGQCFDQENNARAHGKNLENPEPLKVEA